MRLRLKAGASLATLIGETPSDRESDPLGGSKYCRTELYLWAKRCGWDGVGKWWLTYKASALALVSRKDSAEKDRQRA